MPENEDVESISHGDETSPEVLKEALEMGFIPRDQFKGDPDKFIDAESFIERGKSLMPILRKNNETLRGELGQTKAELVRLREKQDSYEESIKALQEFHAEDVKRKIQRAREDAIQELADAREDQDVAREADAIERIAKLERVEEVPARRVAPKQEDAEPEKDYTKEPDYVAWQSRNPWLGKERVKTSLALGIMYDLREKGESSTGKTFFDKVDVEMERYLNPGGGVSRVESARHSEDTSRSSNGRGYADLPREAKDACNKQEKRLVGEGRAFKDVASWRKYYVNKYFEDV